MATSRAPLRGDKPLFTSRRKSQSPTAEDGVETQSPAFMNTRKEMDRARDSDRAKSYVRSSSSLFAARRKNYEETKQEPVFGRYEKENEDPGNAEEPSPTWSPVTRTNGQREGYESHEDVNGERSASPVSRAVRAPKATSISAAYERACLEELEDMEVSLGINHRVDLEAERDTQASPSPATRPRTWGSKARNIGKGETESRSRSISPQGDTQASPSPAARVRTWGSKARNVGPKWLEKNMAEPEIGLQRSNSSKSKLHISTTPEDERDNNELGAKKNDRVGSGHEQIRKSIEGDSKCSSLENAASASKNTQDMPVLVREDSTMSDFDEWSQTRPVEMDWEGLDAEFTARSVQMSPQLKVHHKSTPSPRLSTEYITHALSRRSRSPSEKSVDSVEVLKLDSTSEFDLGLPQRKPPSLRSVRSENGTSSLRKLLSHSSRKSIASSEKASSTRSASPKSGHSAASEQHAVIPNHASISTGDTKSQTVEPATLQIVEQTNGPRIKTVTDDPVAASAAASILRKRYTRQANMDDTGIIKISESTEAANDRHALGLKTSTSNAKALDYLSSSSMFFPDVQKSIKPERSQSPGPKAFIESKVPDFATRMVNSEGSDLEATTAADMEQDMLRKPARHSPPIPINTAKRDSAAEDVRRILREARDSSDDESIISRINVKLGRGLGSIREAQSGISRLEESVALSANNIQMPITSGASYSSSPPPPSPALIAITVSIPRLWRTGLNTWRGWEFTWPGFLLLWFMIWFVLEDQACTRYCPVETLGYWEPINPWAPEFGRAIWYVIEEWLGWKHSIPSTGRASSGIWSWYGAP